MEGLNSGYTIKQNPFGVPSGKGLYLTIHVLSRPETDTISQETYKNCIMRQIFKKKNTHPIKTRTNSQNSKIELC